MVLNARCSMALDGYSLTNIMGSLSTLTQVKLEASYVPILARYQEADPQLS